MKVDLDPRILYMHQIEQIAKALAHHDVLHKEDLDNEILNHFPYGAPKEILPAILGAMTALHRQSMPLVGRRKRQALS